MTGQSSPERDFALAPAVNRLDSSTEELRSPARNLWRAAIAPGWDIASNANGGHLLAIVARALRKALGRPDPVAVSAQYLRPGRPPGHRRDRSRQAGPDLRICLGTAARRRTLTVELRRYVWRPCPRRSGLLAQVTTRGSRHGRRGAGGAAVSWKRPRPEVGDLKGVRGRWWPKVCRAPVSPKPVSELDSVKQYRRSTDSTGHAEACVTDKESPSARVDLARMWVEVTCAAQGLPSKVADASVLRAIAVLLTAGRDLAPPSDLPVRLDSVGVELVATPDSGSDRDGVEQRGNDGPLSRRVDGVPLAS
jgi:hypothetical protein